MENKEEVKAVQEQQEQKKTPTWKYVVNICIILAITALAVFLSVKGQAGEIWDLLTTASPIFLLVLFGVAILQALVRSFIIFCFARLYTRKYKFHQALATDQIGVFYNGVTPGASGGQIMEAYTFKKQGVQISAAVSIMAMYSIAFQIVLITLGLISFIVKYDTLMLIESIPFNIGGLEFSVPIWPLTIFGFSINIFAIVGILLMSYSHAFHNFIMGPCITLLGKIKILKNPDKSRESLRIQVENFKIEFKRLMTNIPFLILIIVLFTAYAALKYSFPYFCGLALGNESTSATLWDSIVLANYHSMVTSLIPIPGAAGVSEYFFIKLFVNTKNPAVGFFYTSAGNSEALCTACLLLWRTFTFILPLLVGGFVAAFYRSSPKNEAKLQGELPNRKTFVSLQEETYVSRYAELNTMIETSTLNREAILAKLKPSKKKSSKKKSSTSTKAKPKKKIEEPKEEPKDEEREFHID